MGSVEIVLSLVVMATVVAAVAGRLSAPPPSLLVLAGLGIGLVPGLPPVRLSPDVVTLVVLPPLLYAAGQGLSVRDLRTVWLPVTVLAIGLVVASAAAVALVAALLLDLPLPVGFVLGAVLASTDPVAVTALARTLRLPPRLEALVAAESLFNDATSLVMFQIAVAVVAVGGGVAWGDVGVQLVRLGIGGVIVGLLVACGVAALRRRTQDPVLETVIMLVTPYSAFVLAQAIHTSAVTAVVVAGVSAGALDPRLTSAANRLQLTAVSATLVFLLESVVFSLIGLQLPSLVRDLDTDVARWLLPAIALTATVVLMRALWVFPVAGLVQRRAGQPLSWRTPAVATWAGTRGVVPLAASLSIPLTIHGGGAFPDRGLLLVLAISVCVITLVVQGLTLRPLTRLSGVAEGPDREQRETAVATLAMAEAALKRAEEFADVDLAPPAALTRTIDSLTERRENAMQRLETLTTTGRAPRRHPGLDDQALRRDLLRTESATLSALVSDGTISDNTWRTLRYALDLEEAALSLEDR